MRVPHPIPYQGSKRKLAPVILEPLRGLEFATLFEPFCGSGAISLYSASMGLAAEYRMNDSCGALARLWQEALRAPAALADEYEALWAGQDPDGRQHYLEVRDGFNTDGDPVKLLYLLARCVKNSPRFNAAGDFNQSADHRRRGMRPSKMRQELATAALLLGSRATVTSADFALALQSATPGDLVYMDPPYEGTSTGPDKRYFASLERQRLTEALDHLNQRGISWLLSYDGRHGDKVYGEPLPSCVAPHRVELDAGRSSQATLSGRSARTIESLYMSADLALSWTSPRESPPQLTLA